MTTTRELIKQFAKEKIQEDDMKIIFDQRFARYSKYIIQERAIPDARDGLKPVQRRILYAMAKMGIMHNTSYKKCARIVGEVIGKYHPHGDTSVYEALVRMSQDFKMRLPLIDLHGNNGSIDGDSAAAMRYTEARLSIYAEYLLNDINKKTVQFIPNFDDEEYEPTVLPAKYPALLINGSTGISAGYATDIPPHNIDEVISAVIYRIKNPDCSLDDITKIIKGPDFPTGGIIQGTNELKKAYKTGKGKIILKSKVDILKGDQINQLIINEIPYGVNKAALVRRMNYVYEKRNISGIAEIRDESDREGLRIVVDIKKDVNPEHIRDFFFKSTELQINYNFNMVAINDKRPMTMSLLNFLDCYIDHQKEIITNRSNFELKSVKLRLHIVDGLISMVSILDAVIKTIRESDNKKDAKNNLISLYNFTEIQAEAIVNLQLYRLTNTDIYALQKEQKELKANQNELEKILSSESTLLEVIDNELNETKNKLSSPRRKVIKENVDELKVDVKNLLQKEEMHLIITRDGYIKRILPKFFNSEGEEHKYKENDFVTYEYLSSTVEILLLFTNKGNYVYLPVSKIPAIRHRDLGYNVSTLANISSDEKIIFAFPVKDFKANQFVLFATKQGLIKRCKISNFKAVRYSNALQATKINPTDELVSVDVCYDDSNEVVVVTKKGFINRYDCNEISVYGITSAGVKAIELKSRPDDEVAFARYIYDSKDYILALLKKGKIKRLKLNDIFKGHKNNVGKAVIRLDKKMTNYVIGGEIIHKSNQNIKMNSYLIGNKGAAPLDYSGLMKANPTVSKETLLKTGTPIEIVISKNENDMNNKN